jgi:uncharacterized protein
VIFVDTGPLVALFDRRDDAHESAKRTLATITTVMLTTVPELMDEYADHPMDLADASLVATAEINRCTAVFTIDRSDFATYRARIGRTKRAFTIVP